MNNMFAAFRATDVLEDQALKVAETIGRHDELLNTAGLPDQDALTVQDFSEVLGWLIIKTQDAGVDVRDQPPWRSLDWQRHPPRCGWRSHGQRSDRQPMTARAVGNGLRREGWTEQQGKGKQAIFTSPGSSPIVVPHHKGDIPRVCSARSVEQPVGNIHHIVEGQEPGQLHRHRRTVGG
jgi:hypothetical protein